MDTEFLLDDLAVDKLVAGRRVNVCGLSTMTGPFCRWTDSYWHSDRPCVADDADTGARRWLCVYIVCLQVASTSQLVERRPDGLRIFHR